MPDWTLGAPAPDRARCRLCGWLLAAWLGRCGRRGACQLTGVRFGFGSTSRSTAVASLGRCEPKCPLDCITSHVAVRGEVNRAVSRTVQQSQLDPLGAHPPI